MADSQRANHESRHHQRKERAAEKERDRPLDRESITFGNTCVEWIFTFVWRLAKKLSVEQVSLVLGIGIGLTSVVKPNLYYEKVCKVGIYAVAHP